MPYPSRKSIVMISTMHKIDLNRMDLNLLSVFLVLMQERSVTRAARRLSLGQPAVSHALARLRSALGDDLFIRHGRVMEPTPRAAALFNDIGPSLQKIETSLRATGAFDPMTSRPVFRVGMSDDVLLAFLPRITSELFNQIPGATVVVLATDYLRAADMLDRGDVSMVMGYLVKLPSAAKVRRLRTVRYKVLRGSRHAGRLTLKNYCQHNHAIVTFAGDLKGYVDESLEGIGASRTIVLSLPQFASLPQILQASDLLVTVPDYVADTLTAGSRLHAEPLPFKSPTFGLSMAWRAAVDSDPAERLLREIIAQAVRTGRVDQPRK